MKREKGRKESGRRGGGETERNKEERTLSCLQESADAVVMATLSLHRRLMVFWRT